MTTNQADVNNPRVNVAVEVRHRIGKALATRKAPSGTLAAKVENKMKGGGSKLWALAKRRPYVGVVMASGGALAIAMAIGGGEITLACIVGYAAYQVLREGVPPKVAAEDAFHAIER
ncbi:MAG: hypothetical protein SFX73_32550 [Kofleriaceae bacterium]|nr:hypothetical protein [Kofleriaceae bacterium]